MLFTNSRWAARQHVHLPGYLNECDPI